jgi:hypothetical protein
VAALAEQTRKPLQDSDYWRDVQHRARNLAPTPRAERLRQCIVGITVQFGAADITLTASHGDWSPWNMWLTGQGLLVWDWERFELATPQGFDLLHFRLNSQFVHGAWSRAEAAQRLIAEARGLLAGSGVVDPAPQTVLLYLVHLGLRYEADGQVEAGAAAGQLETWLLPAVEAALVDPAITRSR